MFKYFVAGRGSDRGTWQKGVHLLPITHTGPRAQIWYYFGRRCVYSVSVLIIRYLVRVFLMCSELYKAIILGSELLHDPCNSQEGSTWYPQHHLGAPRRAGRPPFRFLDLTLSRSSFRMDCFSPCPAVTRTFNYVGKTNDQTSSFYATKQILWPSDEWLIQILFCFGFFCFLPLLLQAIHLTLSANVISRPIR